MLAVGGGEENRKEKTEKKKLTEMDDGEDGKAWVAIGRRWSLIKIIIITII